MIRIVCHRNTSSGKLKVQGKLGECPFGTKNARASRALWRALWANLGFFYGAAPSLNPGSTTYSTTEGVRAAFRIFSRHWVKHELNLCCTFVEKSTSYLSTEYPQLQLLITPHPTDKLSRHLFWHRLCCRLRWFQQYCWERPQTAINCSEIDPGDLEQGEPLTGLVFIDCNASWFASWKPTFGKLHPQQSSDSKTSFHVQCDGSMWLIVSVYRTVYLRSNMYLVTDSNTSLGSRTRKRNSGCCRKMYTILYYNFRKIFLIVMSYEFIRPDLNNLWLNLISGFHYVSMTHNFRLSIK